MSIKRTLLRRKESPCRVAGPARLWIYLRRRITFLSVWAAFLQTSYRIKYQPSKYSRAWEQVLVTLWFERKEYYSALSNSFCITISVSLPARRPMLLYPDPFQSMIGWIDSQTREILTCYMFCSLIKKRGVTMNLERWQSIKWKIIILQAPLQKDGLEAVLAF